MTFDPEPGAIRGLPLARWMRRRGWDVQVLTGFPQYPVGKIYPGYKIRLRQRETMDGVPVLRVPIYPSHDGSALRRSLTYLSFGFSALTLGISQVGPVDLVFICELLPTNGLASTMLRILKGTPVVANIADIWPDSVMESGMVRGGILRDTAGLILGQWCQCLYRQAEVITVLSPGFKRLLVERGVPLAKIKVIYNWTDEETFRPTDPDPKFAESLGFEGKFNIVYAGNFGVLQGLETVIRAAALVRGNPSLQIVLIGTGPKEEALKSLVLSLGANNVLFLGRREYWEMTHIYAVSQALIVHLKDIPFLRTTIPSKTAVSLASGRPILMAVRGDAAELVSRARAGVICPPENPEAMAQAMLSLLQTSKEELQAMGDRGRSFYMENLSLNNAGEQMEAIFRSVA